MRQQFLPSSGPLRRDRRRRAAATSVWVAAVVWAAASASCGSYSGSSYNDEGGWAEEPQGQATGGDREEVQAGAAVPIVQSEHAAYADAPRPASPPPRAHARPADYAAKKSYGPPQRQVGSPSPGAGSYDKSGDRAYSDGKGGKADGSKSGEGVKGEKSISQPMVVYFGYLKLRVRRQIEAFDQITKLAQTAGGYVQSLAGSTIVVRVPAGDFDAAMGRFAAAGETLDRRVKAVDVSRQFTDLEGRLQVAIQARGRLLQLLDKVKNTDERLQILEEIKRLTELIETAEGTLAALHNLANFFTITIDVEPVVADGGQIVHRSPFDWIRNLTAHLVTLTEGKKRIKMTMPRGFVLFEEDDVFRAQAADTSLLRVAQIKNEPRGDAGFWANAVQHEMEGRDEELVETKTVGALQVRVWRNKDVRPRYYLVGAVIAGDWLYVVELFMPNDTAWNLHKDAVWQALATLEVAP